MAFKKTGMGNVQVSPVGMPDLSGYKSFAKSVNAVSDDLYSIGSSMRKREFTEALLEAEIDGKTAGVKFDEEGNLVPLTNLNYGKADKFFGTNDARNLQLEFRKNAIASYALAISNDANRYANNSFANNPENPERVRADFDGYLEGLGEIPEDVRNAIMPTVTAQFVQAENQAQAGLIKKTRLEQETVSLDAIEIASNGMASIYAKQDLTPDGAFDTGTQEMLTEIQSNIAQAKNILAGLGYTESELSNIDNAIKSKIAIRSTEQLIESKWITSGGNTYETLLLMDEIIDQFRDDPSVDTEQLSLAINSTFKNLSTMQTAQRAEQNRVREANYASLLKKFDDPTVLEKPKVTDIAKADLTDMHKSVLFSRLGNYQDGLIADIAASKKEALDNAYEQNMIIMKNPSLYSREQQERAFNNITQLYTQGLSHGQYSSFLKEHTSIINDRLSIEEAATKEAVSAFRANLIIETGEAGGYILHPQRLAQIIQDAQANGYISATGPFTNVEAANMLNAYTKDFNTKTRETRTAMSAMRDAQNGVSLSSTQITSMNKNVAPKSVNILDENGQPITVPLDLQSQDSDTRKASFDAAVAYTVQYPSVIHPQVVSYLQSAENIATEEGFSVYKSFVGEWYDAMKNHKKEGVFWQSVERHGIDESLLRNAMAFDFYNFSQINQMDTTSANRVINAIVPEGQTIEDVVSNNMTFFMHDQTWLMDLISPYPDRQDGIINDYASRSGVWQMGDVIMEDSRVLTMVSQRALSKMANGEYPPNKQGLRLATIDAMGDLIGEIGVEEDIETGQYKWVQKPIINEARKTMGGEPVNLSMDDIKADVVFRLMSEPGAYPEGMLDVLAERDFIFEYNDLSGPIATYKVSMNFQGKRVVLDETYRFDWNTSLNNESYAKALNEIQDSSIKQFWMSLPFMDQVVVNQTYKSIQSSSLYGMSQPDREDIGALISIYNSRQLKKGGATINLDDIPQNEVDRLISYITSLGIG
jgi:hypothetical protein